ncbi:ABC transporter ATP-binding protein [Kitasatospora paranensis]|uniref:ABC transporter ATP-binding protein n=1 Tax=Kitasatospora paranensis TaxID=258053 RepID=A0ABW2G0Q7_9ACTN
MSPLLSVTDLTVRFATKDGEVTAVDGLSFDLQRQKTLAIVGESGSGKSVTSLAVLGLHDPRKTVITGSITLDGIQLAGATDRDMRRVRGRRIAMIFQDPLTALSPHYTVGEQLADAYRRHTGQPRSAARRRAVQMLDRVGIPQPQLRADSYAHQFSGGMRQRAMIAMALMCEPDVLIADEPTTALDVTVQAQILDLFAEIKRDLGTAVVFITHDLGIVAESADDVLVMYAGRAAERGTVREVLGTPQHPYTCGLLGSVPRLDSDPDADLPPIEGSPPDLLNLQAGCAFAPRCPHTELVGAACRDRRPLLAPAGHAAACHLPLVTQKRLFTDQLDARSSA